MLITLVAGARPNFVKLSPIVKELQRRGVPFRWIHTGQHTEAMSDPIVQELELPRPDLRLHAKGSHAEMTAAVMVGVERDLVAHQPDWLVVLGDVNSTLGAALAAAKLGVKIAHVEAGYRSGDWEMPEEVNRVLVDRMSDLLLCPDESYSYSTDGLRPGARVRLVGNVMMDSLRWALKRLEPFGSPGPAFLPRLNSLVATAKTLASPYAVLTVHRPSNVDRNEDLLRSIRIAGEEALKRGLPIIWPAHPRVREDCGMTNGTRIDPLGYLAMVALLRGASLVITDSGGVLEESLYLGKEIVSLRDPAKNERQHLLDGGVPACWREDAAPKIVDALLNTDSR